jgi:hypothetical protein
MVQNVSGQPNGPITDPRVLTHLHNKNADKVTATDILKDADHSPDATQTSASISLEDNATVSSEARARYEQDREVLRFTRLAQRADDTSQAPDKAARAEKIVQLKNMLDSGRINDYLRTVDTKTLVNDILNSPTGTFLR